jgi:peroxiredoxin
MSPLLVGEVAPAIPTIDFEAGPTGLFFYKVTCPTCKLSAPKMRTFEEAYPGRVIGIGQDPEPALARFSEEHAMGIRSVEDAPPYLISDAYAIESVPTLYLVGADGRILESIGAWDREGFNGVSRRLAALTSSPVALISAPGDGLPDFKPG